MKNVRDFFEAYAKASSGDNPHSIAAFYAQDFMAAGPKGAMTFKNDKGFIAWLSDLINFNRQTGMGEMKVSNVNQEPIGDSFTNARVTWATTFKKLGDEVIRFDINYILYHPADEYKIVMYISHEDQEEVMKSKNLIP